MRDGLSFISLKAGDLTIKSLPAGASLRDAVEAAEAFLKGAGYKLEGLYWIEPEGPDDDTDCRTGCECHSLKGD